MLRAILLILMISPLALAAQKTGKDTLLRYFDAALEPVKKKDAVYIGVAVKDVAGWNTVIYNDSIKVVMRGRYTDVDCKIKEGTFIYYSKGSRYMAGNYSRNMRTGAWLTWFPSGQMKDSLPFANDLAEGYSVKYFESGVLESTGEYKQGMINGEWNWFHENGKIATREKYSGGKLASLECFDTLGNPTGFNCAIARPPAIKGRYGGIEKYIKDSLQFPEIALKKDLEGYVTLQFVVNKNGQIEEPEILFSSDPSFSAEAVRVLRSVPAWYPAISHNRVIDHIYTLNIPFYKSELVPVTESTRPELER